MNLNQLRVFHAVARSGSVSGAARVLRVSQPAVSKQVGELESALGVTLFDRMPRGMARTAAGELLWVHAERIFASEGAAEQELSELLGLARGRLRIAASTTIGNYLVPQLLGAFQRAHPGIELSLSIGNAAQVEAEVREQKVELGLSEGFVESDDLDVRTFDHDELIAIGSPHALTHGQGPLSIDELLDMTLLTRESGSGTRAVIEAALAARGRAMRPAMSLGSNEAIKRAVAAGLGVAIVSRLVVQLELEVGRLAEIAVEGLNIQRALHRLELKGREPSPSAAAFGRLLDDPSVRTGSVDYQI